MFVPFIVIYCLPENVRNILIYHYQMYKNGEAYKSIKNKINNAPNEDVFEKEGRRR